MSTIFIAASLAACGDANRAGEDQNNSDSIVGDTMPVVVPGNVDTTRVLTPPPTSDQMNAYPDTTKPR